MNHRTFYIQNKSQAHKCQASKVIHFSIVSETLKQEGTTLVVINSVCGCAAGACRPGVLMAINNATKKPDTLATSFAGFRTS